MRKIRFLSSNQNKINEVKAIMEPEGFEIIPINHKIEELQTDDVSKLTKDKCLKSYKYSGRPIFVEHTGLYMKNLNNFPAGLTQIFWDKLEADNVTKFFSGQPVVAKTVIGYCDGYKIHTFDGQINGRISNEPLGKRTFQWDCVFIPDGMDQTFAEMGDSKKNDISMRSKALNNFVDYLKGLPNA